MMLYSVFARFNCYNQHTACKVILQYTLLVMCYCRCLNSFLYYDGVQYGGWAGPDGVIQESFAGTPENGQGCACANDGSCQCK